MQLRAAQRKSDDALLSFGIVTTKPYQHLSGFLKPFKECSLIKCVDDLKPRHRLLNPQPSSPKPQSWKPNPTDQTPWKTRQDLYEPPNSLRAGFLLKINDLLVNSTKLKHGFRTTLLGIPYAAPDGQKHSRTLKPPTKPFSLNP